MSLLSVKYIMSKQIHAYVNNVLPIFRWDALKLISTECIYIHRLLRWPEKAKNCKCLKFWIFFKLKDMLKIKK